MAFGNQFCIAVTKKRNLKSYLEVFTYQKSKLIGVWKISPFKRFVVIGLHR